MCVLTRAEAQKLAKKRDVVIPKGYTVIDNDAFKFSDIGSVEVPEGVVVIGRAAFYGCARLKYAVLPNSVAEIGEYAFYRCVKLAGLTLPDGIVEIKHNTFEGCKGLTSLVIPDSVTEIGEGAFKDCSRLKGITIPDGVSELKAGVFEGCSYLTSVSIHDGVTAIGERAFKGCHKLKILSPKDSFAHRYCNQGFFKKIKWEEADSGKGVSLEKFFADNIVANPGQSSVIDGTFRDFISELEGVKRFIKDPETSVHVGELNAVTRQIYRFIAEHPESDRRVDKKVMDYYFPTALKLLKTYVDVSREQVKVSEMDKIIKNISPALEGIVNALKNQLDSLYQAKSMDLSSDIDVLNHMLAMDGVKKTNQ